MTERVRKEAIIEVAPIMGVLPAEFVGILSGATPSVMNCSSWKAGGDTVTITNFKDGQEGQQINILGDGTTTVANNDSIKTDSGSDTLLLSNKVYRFVLFDSIWYQGV